MDEIEYKLNTNNSVLVVNAIDKLISAIKLKFKPAERQRFVLENEELKLLREKCMSKEAIVSLTACQGLLALVELGVLEIAHTMSTVVTLLPSAHNYSAITSTMAGLLVLDLKSRLVPGTQYKCQFSVKSPQHPFITVLERNKDAENDVFAQMQAICNHPDYIVSSNSLELLRAVFLYMTCAPRRPGSLRPWTLLLSLEPAPRQRALLLACLTSQRYCSPSGIEGAFGAYSAVCEHAIYRRDTEYVTALLPLLARISNEMLKHGRDPRACYTLMERCVAAGTSCAAAGVSLLLLAENVPRSPALYLHDIFNLCLNILNKHPVPSISLNAFVGQSLQWLHLPSYLTSAALASASKILQIYQEGTKIDTSLNIPNLMNNTIFQTILHTDSHLSITVKVLSVWEKLRNTHGLDKWLYNIDSIHDSVRVGLLTFLYGLLMGNEAVALRVLGMVVGLMESRRDIAVEVLPILVYKIANDPSPAVKLECLKALPLMAQTKENVPTIVSILNKLKTGKGVPTSFLISLYATLAETQVRCFPYLQEMLAESGANRPDDLRWEIDIAKISAVKRICYQGASSHGLELVPVISSTLNRCSDRAGVPAACLALRCIARLWRSGALAPASAWRALSPKLQRDSRPEVLLQVCNLLSELPALANQSPEYAQLERSACALLWQYQSEGAPPLVAAACEALAKFPMSSYTLKDIPEIYRKTIKLPASYCKTPSDAARKPEDVLDYIPCEVWPEVFKYSNQAALGAVVLLAQSLLEREVREYRSGVYHVQGTEPATCAHLSPHSAVRGLMDALRKQVTSPSYSTPEPATLAILSALGSDLCKPLPPVDLHYLAEVCARGGDWKRRGVTMAARCGKVSPSAKAVVVNWLHDLQREDTKESEIILFYELLPTLARNIPPNSLRGPLERTLTDAYSTIAHIKNKIPYENTLLSNLAELSRRNKISVKSGSQADVNSSKVDKNSSQVDENSSQVDKNTSQVDKNSSQVDKSSQIDERLTKVDGEEYLFVRQLKLIKTCLECERIHDANRTLLSQLVEHYFTVIKDDNVSWPGYVDVCTSLSCTYIERMTSPSGWWGVDADSVRRAGCVRAACASHTRAVHWINEIVDAQADQLSEQEFSLHYVLAAVIAAEDSAATRDWFLQLLARTQVAFNEMEELSGKLYMCSVFLVSVAALSGLWALEEPPALLTVCSSAACALLPAAAAALLARDHWTESCTQMLEWVCHTRALHPEVGRACQRTLLALRHTQPYVDNNIWTRLESYFGKEIVEE